MTEEAARNTASAGDRVSFDVTFLLLDNFSLISFSTAIEPLRLTNKVLKRQVFRYKCCSPDGSDARASNGMSLRVDMPLADVRSTDLLVICSSDDVEKVVLSGALKAKVRELMRGNCTLAGICTGAYVLAELGLLRDRKCTIHWEYADIFRERFPLSLLDDRLVQRDGNILTCAGGTSAFELMVGFIQRNCGLNVGRDVADIALHHGLRAGSASQRSEIHLRLGITNAPLLKCIEIMEANIEETVPIGEITRRIGISRRQLERLFRQYFDDTPTNYYRKFRLNAARRLVQHTPMPIVDVAIASGFVNASHFTKCYRKEFGISPAEDRITVRRATIAGHSAASPAPV